MRDLGKLIIVYKFYNEFKTDRDKLSNFNDNNTPDANPSCKNCAYARQRSLLEKA